MSTAAAGAPSGLGAVLRPRCVLRRPLYRGEIVWNKSRKRDQWGQKKQRPRASADWIRTEDPTVRIVPAV